MPAPGYKLLTDLPTLTREFPRAVTVATVAAHREAVTTWRDRPEFPGLAHRFTWGFSKGGRTAMRRRKYGSPTSLRVHYANQGFPMPQQRMPGKAGRPGPNRDKPWYVQSGAMRQTLLARRPRTVVSGGQVTTTFKLNTRVSNVLSGQNMRGVATAHWVKVPVSYQMTVYKDAVNRAGAYRIQVTRGIPRWFHTFAGATYRQQFEDTTADKPWLARLATQLLRRNYRDIVINERGQVRAKFRRAQSAGKLAASEVALLQGGTALDQMNGWEI